MKNKYIRAFREACEKLEEKGDFRKWNWNDIPPESYTEKQSYAIKEFDNLLKQIQEGLITRKEFLQRADILYNDLPDWDWTRDKDAKLPDTLFPEACEKLKEDFFDDFSYFGDDTEDEYYDKLQEILEANENSEITRKEAVKKIINPRFYKKLPKKLKSDRYYYDESINSLKEKRLTDRERNEKLVNDYNKLPREWTEDQKLAIDTFENLKKELNYDTISAYDFAMKLIEENLYERLPNFDYLPKKIMPRDYYRT